jgi:hypothetical protein
MVNPQLTAYIKENYPKFPKETVIQSLTSVGWSAVDISAAFMELEHPAPAPTPVAPVAPSPAPAVPPAQPTAPVSVAPVIVPPQPVVTVPLQTPPVMNPSPVAPPQAAPQSTVNPNAAFLAEMEKRRREAEALNPQTAGPNGVTISVGSVQTSTTTNQGGLVGMVIKTGLVKNEQQANMVLIGVIVVCMGLAAWFIL